VGSPFLLRPLMSERVQALLRFNFLEDRSEQSSFVLSRIGVQELVSLPPSTAASAGELVALFPSFFFSPRRPNQLTLFRRYSDRAGPKPFFFPPGSKIELTNFFFFSYPGRAWPGGMPSFFFFFFSRRASSTFLLPSKER